MTSAQTSVNVFYSGFEIEFAGFDVYIEAIIERMVTT